MKRTTTTMKRWLVAAAMTSMAMMPVQAQEGDYASETALLSPDVSIGIGFNADTNHPIFSGSLRLMAELGRPSDLLGINIGVGYRGFYDRNPPYEFIRHATFSDYMLYSDENGYSKNVRPVGGQLILPAEAHLRPIRLDDDLRLFFGCGVEYGLRLYQSHRYANYYGDHILNSGSLSIYPMVGIDGAIDDDINISLSLYLRHFVRCPFNYDNLWDPKKFDARNFFGIQINVTIPTY